MNIDVSSPWEPHLSNFLYILRSLPLYPSTSHMSYKLQPWPSVTPLSSTSSSSQTSLPHVSRASQSHLVPNWVQPLPMTVFSCWYPSLWGKPPPAGSLSCKNYLTHPTRLPTHDPSAVGISSIISFLFSSLNCTLTFLSSHNPLEVSAIAHGNTELGVANEQCPRAEDRQGLLSSQNKCYWVSKTAMTGVRQTSCQSLSSLFPPLFPQCALWFQALAWTDCPSLLFWGEMFIHSFIHSSCIWVLLRAGPCLTKSLPLETQLRYQLVHEAFLDLRLCPHHFLASPRTWPRRLMDTLNLMPYPRLCDSESSV